MLFNRKRSVQSESFMFKLRGEIRNVFHDHLLTSPDPIQLDHTRENICPEYLATCQLARYEATEILYHRNTFETAFDVTDPPPVPPRVVDMSLPWILYAAPSPMTHDCTVTRERDSCEASKRKNAPFFCRTCLQFTSDISRLRQIKVTITINSPDSYKAPKVRNQLYHYIRLLNRAMTAESMRKTKVIVELAGQQSIADHGGSSFLDFFSVLKSPTDSGATLPAMFEALEAKVNGSRQEKARRAVTAAFDAVLEDDCRAFKMTRGNFVLMQDADAELARAFGGVVEPELKDLKEWHKQQKALEAPAMLSIE
ncbi:MAG: hypothetical protein MMC23_000352 [Stictis urceolatum]|nr:hypothetical protein [Stictis urceolata]